MHISFAFFQVFEQDFLVVCLCLHTSLWFVCAPYVTQTLRQKGRRRHWGEIPVSAAGQGWGCTLSRGQTQPWYCWLRKGDGECLRVLVSGLKPALGSSIPLPQLPGSVAVVQLCFPTGTDETMQEGSSWYQLCALPCVPCPLPWVPCPVCPALCAAASPALRHSAEGKHLRVSLGGTKFVFSVRQAPSCSFLLATVAKKWTLKFGGVGLGSQLINNQFHCCGSQ